MGHFPILLPTPDSDNEANPIRGDALECLTLRKKCKVNGHSKHSIIDGITGEYIDGGENKLSTCNAEQWSIPMMWPIRSNTLILYCHSFIRGKSPNDPWPKHFTCTWVVYLSQEAHLATH